MKTSGLPNCSAHPKIPMTGVTFASARQFRTLTVHREVQNSPKKTRGRIFLSPRQLSGLFRFRARFRALEASRIPTIYCCTKLGHGQPMKPTSVFRPELEIFRFSFSHAILGSPFEIVGDRLIPLRWAADRIPRHFLLFDAVGLILWHSINHDVSFLLEWNQQRTRPPNYDGIPKNALKIPAHEWK